MILGVGQQQDATLRLFDVASRNQVASFQHQGEDAGGALTSLAFSENGYLLATGDESGTMKIWDLRKIEESVKTVSGLGSGGADAVMGLSFDPSGSYLAVAAGDGYNVFSTKVGVFYIYSARRCVPVSSGVTSLIYHSEKNTLMHVIYLFAHGTHARRTGRWSSRCLRRTRTRARAWRGARTPSLLSLQARARTGTCASLAKKTGREARRNEPPRQLILQPEHIKKTQSLTITRRVIEKGEARHGRVG